MTSLVLSKVSLALSNFRFFVWFQGSEAEIYCQKVDYLAPTVVHSMTHQGKSLKKLLFFFYTQV